MAPSTLLDLRDLPTMPAKAVLFDLDGTLLDTLADIAGAANAALAREAMPTHPPTAYRQFIGDGVAMLFRRALPTDQDHDDARIERCVAHFHATYATTWNATTQPYPGIAGLLDALTARNLPMAILSNKPHEFTQLCAGEFLDAWPWRAVIGQRDGIPRKPDPTSALAIARDLGFDPSLIVYVGDSSVDMRTARAAGMPAVGVSWGFRPVAELRETGASAIIDEPDDLLAFLDR